MAHPDPRRGGSEHGPSASSGHEHQRVAGGTGGTSGKNVKTGANAQDTPPLKAKTSRVKKPDAMPEGDGADASD